MSPARRLRHSADSEPGIRRRGAPGSFSYVGANGRLIVSERTLERIRALAIPPAWTDVWICSDSAGHLQATGRDARGRKQYRYAHTFRQGREAYKFDRMRDFARALPAIRRRVRADLRLPGLPRRKVLAAIVRLLEDTCMRIGNERYAEENGSFGLTTLRNRHARVERGQVEIEFRGKSGKFHHAEIRDPRVSEIVMRCRELPGRKLFKHLDDPGRPQAVDSSEVNAYLKEIAGREVTAKDFRTWAGSVLVAAALSRREGRIGPSHVVAAVHQAARRLGNTPAICRKSYVHPRVLDPGTWGAPRRASPRGLRADEVNLLRVLSGARVPSGIYPKPGRGRTGYVPGASVKRSRGARPRPASRPTSPRAAPGPS